jgi:hypothetical protein
MTIKIGNANQTVNVGSNQTLVVGDGNDTIITLDYDVINVGNGNDTITIGSHDTLTVGGGTDTITAGNFDRITATSVSYTISAGSNAIINAGNGSGTIVAGPNSIITAGKGNDTVKAGANTTITLGYGADSISAGTSDAIILAYPVVTQTPNGQTIQVGSGLDTISYDGLTPKFTAPASLSVNEEKAIALPITLGPPALGNEVITGFQPGLDVIRLDTADFPNYAAVIADASQVGSNTVITLDPSDTITLTGVAKSSLTAANFQFFTGPQDVVNITGVPLDETLSAGTNNGGGSWTLTPAQLSGLQLDAGEPIGYPTPVNLTVAITNPVGQGATASQNISLVVNPTPPTVGISVLAAQAGDPATETRLLVTASTDDADGGNDYINRLVISGMPAGVTLSTPTTITTSGHPGTVSQEVDVFAPAGQSTNFNLGVTAYADEPNAPEVSAATSQNINIVFSAVPFNPDFVSTNQSIWASGSSFIKTFDNFLGIDYPSGFPGSSPASVSTSVLGVSLGASFGLKAGFQSDLTVNSGSFNGQLPFNVTLAETDNKTNNTLEIDPSEAQLGGGSFTTTGAGGSYKLDFVFDVFAKAFGGPIHVTLATSVDIPLLSKNSSTLGGSISLPDGFGTVAFHWPQVNTTGSNSSPGAITSQGTSAPIFQVNLDPIAIVLDAILGSDPLKGSAGSAPLQVSYTILAATLAPGIDLQQSFKLNPGSLIPTLKNGLGSTIPFSFGSPTILDNPTNTNFDLTLTPDPTLSNNTSLAGQLVVGLRALKASVTIGFPPLSTTASVGPLINPKTTFGPAAFATLYQNTFPVAFQPQTVSFSAV